MFVVPAEAFARLYRSPKPRTISTGLLGHFADKTVAAGGLHRPKQPRKVPTKASVYLSGGIQFAGLWCTRLGTLRRLECRFK